MSHALCGPDRGQDVASGLVEPLRDRKHRVRRGRDPIISVVRSYPIRDTHTWYTFDWHVLLGSTVDT